MNNYWFRFWICSCLLFLTNVGLAENNQNEVGGSPSKDQLIGFWKLHPLEKQDANKVNPWPMAYQWFGFYENGQLFSMMKSEDENYSADDLQAVFSALPKQGVPQYELHGQMLLVSYPDMKDYGELWGVNFLYRDISSVLKQGDLIMSLDDGHGEVVYYRHLKRIK